MHTCGQSKKKKKGKKPREQQHVNEKQNKTILQLWPKHCCWLLLPLLFCVFFFVFLRKVGKISQWNVTAELRQRRQQRQRSIGGVLSSMKYRKREAKREVGGGEKS